MPSMQPPGAPYAIHHNLAYHLQGPPMPMPSMYGPAGHSNGGSSRSGLASYGVAPMQQHALPQYNAPPPQQYAAPQAAPRADNGGSAAVAATTSNTGPTASGKGGASLQPRVRVLYANDPAERSLEGSAPRPSGAHLCSLCTLFVPMTKYFVHHLHLWGPICTTRSCRRSIRSTNRPQGKDSQAQNA